MNTKQLWTALTLNAHTNSCFDGIYSSDTLKEIKYKPKLIICNTDPSNKPGKHWVLFYFEGNTVDFYDSLGKELSYYGDDFINFVKRFGSEYNQCTQRTQPVNSSLCGIYCLYYAYGKAHSYGMDKIVNSMITPKHVVDFVKRKFYICPEYNCLLLQKCVDC